MSDFRPVQTLSVRAAAAIAAHRFITAAGAVPAANGAALGVALASAASGDMVPVVCLGSVRVDAAEAIAVGAAVGTNASGQAITFASGNKLGVALSAAGGSGQRVEVFLIPNA